MIRSSFCFVLFSFLSAFTYGAPALTGTYGGTHGTMSGSYASVTIADVAPTGADRLLVVSLASWEWTRTPVVSSVTFGGVALTKLTGGGWGGNGNFEVWYLVNPSTISASVEIAFANTLIEHSAIVSTYSGVDQASPFGALATLYQGASASATVSPASSASDLLLFFAAADDLGVITTGSAGLTLAREECTAGYCRHALFTAAGGNAGGTITEGGGASGNTSAVGVALRSAEGTNTAQPLRATYGGARGQASGSYSTISVGGVAPTGTNRLLVVSLASWEQTSAPVVSSVTFGGDALTRLAVGGWGGNGNFEVWYLVNPGTSAASVDITFSNAAIEHSVIVSTYSGVDQATPFGMPSTSYQGASESATVAPSGNTGDLLLFFGATDDWGTAMVGSSGLTLAREEYTTGYCRHALFTAPGGTASGTIAGGGGSSGNTSAIGVAIRPASSASPTVILTAPASGASFTLPALVTLTATAASGTVNSVQFFNGSTSLGLGIRLPSQPGAWQLTTTFSPSALQSFNPSLIAVATDNAGASTASAPVAITLLPSLPYTAGFETAEGYVPGTLNHQLGWSVSAGAAQIVSGATVQGTQYVHFSPGTAAAVINQEFGSRTDNPAIAFVDFYAKPVAGMDTTTGTQFDLEAARVVCVRNGAEGQLQALDGDGLGSGIWKPLVPTMTLDASNVTALWQRITARLNYTTQTYDLYLNGVMIAADLKFRIFISPYVSWFSVKGHTEASAALDSLYAGAACPLFADTNNNGLDDVWETAHGLSLSGDDRTADPDGDGRTNLQEYLAGTDPQNFFDGQDLVIKSLLAPGSQLLPGGKLKVWIGRTDGAPYRNATVTFTIISGANNLTDGESQGPIYTVQTANDGTAEIALTPKQISGGGGDAS